jgi:hypothetical protein
VGPLEAVGAPTRGCVLPVLWTAITIDPILVSHIKSQMLNNACCLENVVLGMEVLNVEYTELSSLYIAV